MSRKEIDILWDRLTRNNINDNFKELYDVLNNIVETITEEALQQIIDGSKLNWLSPPLDNTSELPISANEGDVIMVRDKGDGLAGVYRYDGIDWELIQEFDPTAVNEVDNRLSAEIDTINSELTNKVSQTDYTNDLNGINAEIDNVNDKISRLKLSEIAKPWYICHRGGANIHPENTLKAYEGCLSMNLFLLELDVQHLSDGVLGVMHDDTMNRTTDKSGYVKNYSSMGFSNAGIDVLPGWNGVKPPLLEEVLSRFGNNAIYIIESKDKQSSQDIVNALKRYRLEEYSMVTSFSLSDLQTVNTEDIPLMLATDTEDPQTIINAGIDYVGVSTNATDNYINSCINAGLEVIVYTVNRRYERDHYLNLGVSGFFSDDPLYVKGNSPVLAVDPFGEQVFTHGMFSPKRNIPTYNGGNRGTFVSPDKFGWPDSDEVDYMNDFSLQGWAGDLPSTFTLTAKMTLQKSVSSTYWGSIAFCTVNDIWTDTSETTVSSGYHLLLRENGSLQLYRRDEGAGLLLEEIATTSLSNGQVAELQIQVTTTDIIITRVDTSDSFTVSDATYRKGYMHLGRRVSGILFNDINIT